MKLLLGKIKLLLLVLMLSILITFFFLLFGFLAEQLSKIIVYDVSAWLSFIGSLVGASIAVAGALYVQDIVNKSKENKHILIAAISIRGELENILVEIRNEFINKYSKYSNKPYMYIINNDYHRNISMLSYVLDEHYLKKILYIYNVYNGLGKYRIEKDSCVEEYIINNIPVLFEKEIASI